MSFEFLFIIFILGVCVGSFVNVVIYRSLHGLSPYKGRSFCDNCKRQLRWFENIPLFSYLALRGRCRTCKKSIDWSYPLVELVTGLLFLWWATLGVAFFRLTQTPLHVIQPGYWLIIGILLLIIFFTDLQYGIIPDFSVLLLSLLSILYRSILLLWGPLKFVDFGLTLLASLGSLIFFFGLYLLTKKKGIGFGDVKFAVPMGLILGYPKIIVGIFLSFVIGGIIGTGLLVTGNKKFGQKVPFGPFLIVGLVIALLWGNPIWHWYLGQLTY